MYIRIIHIDIMYVCDIFIYTRYYICMYIYIYMIYISTYIYSLRITFSCNLFVLLTLIDFSMIFSFFYGLVLISHTAFSLCTIFKPN